MNSDRIKEIQEGTAYPYSVSVQQALLQVWNECEQEQVKNCSIPNINKGEAEPLINFLNYLRLEDNDVAFDSDSKIMVERYLKLINGC